MKRKNLISRVAICLYLVLALVLCVGCYPTEVHEIVNRTKYIDIETEVIVKKVNGNGDFKIITIDSCEYVFYSTHMAASGTITHKGNCKYCAKRAMAN